MVNRPALFNLAGDGLYENPVWSKGRGARCVSSVAALPFARELSQRASANSGLSQKCRHFEIYPLFLVTLLAVLILALLGCGIIDGTEESEVDIRGIIMEVNRFESPGTEHSAILGAVLLEGVVEEDTLYDKASITITRETAIFEQRGAERHSANFEDLVVGMRAEVAFAGPVRETYPFQGTAAELVILSTP